VEVNETINTGDVLFIDGEDKEVKLNNSFVNYDGIVDNELQTGSNIVKFDFTPAATFTASVTELHKRKYL